MGSVERRVGAGFAVLLMLFVALVAVQLFVGDRLQTRHQRHAERIEQALTANVAVLQHMTDAETGIRGFQLTGEEIFLEPYDSGRRGAFIAFDRVTERIGDPEVRRLVSVERQAAAHWLYAYATPIVNAGVADVDTRRAQRGREMFDRIRAANADVDAAIQREQRAVARTYRRQSGLAQLLFAGLAATFLVVALILATVHQRQLLAPLEHIRHTLRRLADGEHSARAVPAGPGELRAVIGTLNHLATQTERLLEAEQARGVRTELRQAVATELRTGPDAAVVGPRIAEMIGRALGADAVHGQIAFDAGDPFAFAWPADVATVSPRTVADVMAGEPGVVLLVPHVIGGLAVPLRGDSDGPAGLLYLVRRDRPRWTGDEGRLLEAVAREIEYEVLQQRLAARQSRLIDELRVLDERKDTFVATVTHELRTPLTSILGYVEMLGDGDGGELSPMQQRGVSAILRNALRLQETIGDLLLLDPANSRSALVPVPVDLAEVLSDVGGELSTAATTREVSVRVEAGPGWVNGDAGQLRRAVRNLVDNGIKFTGAGGQVTCRLSAVGGRMVLSVSDTGIGIPAEDLPGLFTPFHRAANAVRMAVQGSGLGLAIVQNIVTEHGGTVSVVSRLDEGSTFTVTLPAVAAPADRAAPPVLSDQVAR